MLIGEEIKKFVAGLFPLLLYYCSYDCRNELCELWYNLHTVCEMGWVMDVFCICHLDFFFLLIIVWVISIYNRNKKNVNRSFMCDVKASDTLEFLLLLMSFYLSKIG